MRSPNFYVIISDANVLIDFLKADEEVIKIACTTIFEIHVPLPLLNEIDQLSEAKAKRLGLRVFEPSLQQLTEIISANQRLSFEDNLCLRVARDEGWICLTNDKVLRKECFSNKVNTLWGLEVMLILNDAGYLSKRHAAKVAKDILETNRRLTGEVVSSFLRRLK